jgi:hypothetical protein
MDDLLIRLLIGGLVISAFSSLGDILRPKSFAGLFGAVPSIALATVGLTIQQNGKTYAALECRSMVVGAIAFFMYALNVSWVLKRYRPSALRDQAARSEVLTLPAVQTKRGPSRG